MIIQSNNGMDNNPVNSSNQNKRGNFWDRLKSIPANRLAFLWLLLGFVLLPFTFFQTVIPLAAWLAPIFLLRFARTARRTRVALPLIFLAYAGGIFIGLRGSDSSNIGVFILGIITFPLIRGIMYTLPYAADRLAGARLPSWARLLVFPLAFTTVDWLMSLSRLINSTGSLAYSQHTNLALLQVISVTGMWGITFLITWCGSTMNALWEHGFDWRPVKAQVITFIVVLLALIGFGSVRLAFAAPAAPTVQVATITMDSAVTSGFDKIIGVNFNQSNDSERAAARPKFERTVNQLLARTEMALRGGAKIVGWQEGSATVLEEDKQSTLDRVTALAKQYDAYIEVSIGLLTRTKSQFFIRNQSILVGNNGAILWTYDKAYPVFPVEAYVVIAGPGKLPIVDSPYGRLSTAICNDMHFMPLLRQAGQMGVDILISPYHDVHPFETEDAVVATYRAIENGFSLVRPTGAGFSTVVDYEGHMLGSQNYFTSADGIMITSAPTHGVRTIYSRIGDLFAYLCAAGLVFLSAWAFIHRKESKAAVDA